MDTLLRLVTRIHHCFGVYICVHDVSGVTYSRAALSLPYDWKSHGCAYCSCAKQCIGVGRCMLQKQLVMWRLKRNGAQPFFGVCNMGVCEYILPVVQEGRMLAVVFASGVTREDAQNARQKLLQSLAGDRYPNHAEVLRQYDRFTAETASTRPVMQFLAELVRERILHTALAYNDGAQQDGLYPVEAVKRRQSGTVRAILDYIEGDPLGPITLTDLSSVFFISQGHLCRIFRKEMGMSIMTFIKQLRMRKAASLLLETDAPVSAIAQQVGVSDPNYFCRTFKSVMGVSPTRYREASQTLERAQAGQDRASVLFDSDRDKRRSSC